MSEPAKSSPSPSPGPSWPTPRFAHWLSTIRDADNILVMEKGRIVEQGNPKVLLGAHGAYHRQYMSQFAGFDAGDVQADDSTAVHS